MLSLATAHVLGGWFTIAFEFPRLDVAQRAMRVQDWARRMLAVLDIPLEVLGTPPAHGPLLLVANHISWLDIFVVLASHPSVFVAKSEIRDWPLVGWLCARVGTLFIERGRRSATRCTGSARSPIFCTLKALAGL